MYYQPQISFTPNEVLAYLRKSQSDDPLLTVEEVLAKHEAILDEWAERNLGGKVPEQNKFREVVSGETMKERPGIRQVLRLIESPKIKAVLVVEPQRLTRGDGEEIGRLMKLLKYTNTIVLTQYRNYDLRDDYDWEAFKRELEKGNDYLEYSKKILNRGRLLSVSQGNFIGSIAPYGYDKTTVKDGKRVCPTLKENPEQADIVRMIFDMYVNRNKGFNIITNHLNEMKVKPPRGKHWNAESMRDMISNIHYIGKVRWNWRKTMNYVEDGEIKKSRPKMRIGEYLVYEGKHDGIISEEIFYAAQEKKGRNPRHKPKTKVRNPLAGLVYCKCGKAMTLRTYKDKKGQERSAPRLLCNGQVLCGTGSCLLSEVMDQVSLALKDSIKDFEIRIKQDEGDSAKLHASLIKNLEERVKELEERELAQWKQQSHPDPSQQMPPHIFKKLNDELLKEKEEVNDALCKAYESMPEPVNYEDTVKRFRDALDALNDPEVSAIKKNALLKACIERIVYHREAPQRKKGKGITQAGVWTNPPIELDINLKV